MVKTMIVYMNKSVNEILKQALKGENLAQLTRKLGLPRGFLHRIVKEGRSPSLNNLDALKTLSEYLGISLEKLLTGEDEGKIISSICFEDKDDRGLRKYRVSIERLK